MTEQELRALVRDAVVRAKAGTGSAGTQVRGYAGTTGTSGTTGALTIVAPLAGATYLFDPTLRAEFQQLPLRALGGAAGEREWTVDGVSVGRARSDDTLRWSLERGTHVISVRDTAGTETRTQITVR